jgi:choline dehydrogenase-like flavoprotein
MPENRNVRYKPSQTVDFVIVGSGAAGGIIAKELSTAGFSAVVLEQGPRLVEADFDHDEFGAFFRSRHSNDPALQPQTFRYTASEAAKEAQPSTGEWSAAATRTSPQISGARA